MNRNRTRRPYAASKVHRIDLGTEEGFRVSLLSYGATLLSVSSADKSGYIEEITLNHDTLEDVLNDFSYYGPTVGRVANRIGGASFSVDGEVFSLDANDGDNTLHSGSAGVDKVVWAHNIVSEGDRVGVEFQYDSPDGEGGFPGFFAIKVTYSISPGSTPGTGELHTEMSAEYVADEGSEQVRSPINLSNHAYWNLSGHLTRTVLGHTLMMPADRYLPTDDGKIPTGEIASVDGTAFDLLEEANLGYAIEAAGGLFVLGTGVDQCLVHMGTSDDGQAENGGDNLHLMAVLHDPESGRVLELSGTQPSVQVYTGNWLSQDPTDWPHVQYNAVALEHMQFPDAVNRPEWADSVLLAPGDTSVERAKHIFFVKDD